MFLTKINHDENHYFSDANYSIKQNIKILLEYILQIDMYMRIENLKKNWKFAQLRLQFRAI